MATNSPTTSPKDLRSNLNLPLGLRNNNPGNMRPTGDSWQGMAGSDGGFLQFVDLSYGIRAWLVDYYGKLTRKGFKTVRQYIEAYAPPSENNTEVYIKSVCSETGLTPASPLPTQRDKVTSLMMAIFRHENGNIAATYIRPADITLAYSRLDAVKQAFFFTGNKFPNALAAGGFTSSSNIKK